MISLYQQREKATRKSVKKGAEKVQKLKVKYNIILLYIQAIITTILVLNINSLNSLVLLFYLNTYFMIKNFIITYKKLS